MSLIKKIPGLIGAGMLAIAVSAPFATIAPAYARPAPVLPPGSVRVPLDVTFGSRLRLVGADVEAQTVEPGQSIEIVLYWEAAAPIEQDYSTFAQLLDENDIVVAQRDMFPGQGLWPTSQMQPGDVIASRYVLSLPATTYAPSRLTWQLGVYEFSSGARLALADGRDNVRFGSIRLERAGSAASNPLAYNLDDQIDLLGYEMDRRAAAPGETVHLTLYWRARLALPADYTVFTHVLQPPETLWAQHDKPLTPPSSTWPVGQVISDTYSLTIKPDAPAGVYEVEIGVYNAASPTFERLRVITSDGRITENRILLSRVRVVR